MMEQQPTPQELLGGVGTDDLALVTAAEYGAGLVISISGEVDISNVEGVSRVLNALPNAQDGLLIDLSDVTYLDSSAVSVLHDLAMRLRARAQRLIVVSAPATPPRRILELTALDANASIADALEQGLRLFGDTEPR